MHSLVKGQWQRAFLLIAFLCAASSAASAVPQVTLAGFAFNGEWAEAANRYPTSYRILQSTKVDGQTGLGAVSRLVVSRAKAVNNPQIQLNLDSLASLRSSDQALVAALVLTGETVVVESFKTYHKIFVSLRADALFFDFKSQTIVRSFPINVVAFDASTTPPSAAQLDALVGKLLFGEDAASIVSQFMRRLGTAAIPAPGTKTVQIRSAQVSKDVLAFYPSNLQTESLAAGLLSDLFASTLSAKTGVPLIPSKVTHSTGVMRVRFEDMHQYDLKIPEGDYVFALNLKRVAKIKHASNNVGTSFIYGAFVDLEFSEPLLGTKFFSAELKNGETAVVPAGRQNDDDFPAYQDAVRGLFEKFGDAVMQPSSKWLKSATSSVDAEEQVKRTKTVLEGTIK